MRPLVIALFGLLLISCGNEEIDTPVYESAAVERRSIEVSVGSSGIVEPLATVEVKSKASGEVLELLVDTGDNVEESALLVRIDPRTVRNRLAQAEAEFKAAQSRRSISETQMQRAESLLKNGTFTEADYEEAALELANAEAQVVSTKVAVENARIAVDDTDIRAPVSGTIIDKPVEKGQVISSPTQDFAGGTLLLTMADLSAVRIRALVDETDIGKVRPGMHASVTVAAYPNQPFSGEVTKIEPKAVVEQNVTMFAVLVSIQNPEGLLMPGMNAEVEVSIARSDDVLTIPVIALRTERDVVTTAGILGMSESALRGELKSGDGGSKEDTRDAGAPATMMMGDRTIELPPGVEADTVREIMARRRSGQNLSQSEQQLMRRVFQDAGGAPGDGTQGSRRPKTDYRFGGKFWVILDDNSETRIAIVRTGLTDLDRVEILSGLDEKDEVLLLPSAHLVETQQQLQLWITRRVGGVPGIESR
jgi:HlyD family secretion protein